MSPQHIQDLLQSNDRYSMDNVPKLEEHLSNQLKQGDYDLDANLALLKLYLLFPNETKVENIEGVLLKALMAYPSTDFSLCMYQIHEKYHTDLKDVRRLGQQLEMAKFKTFWKESESVEILSKASGWQKAVRKFIAGLVSTTYRSIKVEVVMELLNLQDRKELDAISKEHDWSLSPTDNGMLNVSTASFQSVPVEPKAPTNMSLEQYTALVKASS